MSNRLKRTAWALAIGLALVQVFPVAADLLVCIDDRPNRGCCDTPSTPVVESDAAPRLVDITDCGCCVRVHVVSITADAAIQNAHHGWSVVSVCMRGHVVPVEKRIASLGSEEPDNPRLPSLRAVVLLI